MFCPKVRSQLSGRFERECRGHSLCTQPVAPPKGTLEYQHYFVASVPGDAAQIKANEPKRVELYKSVAALVRAYSAIANELEEAGYSAYEATAIKSAVAHFVAVKDEVELGDYRLTLSHPSAPQRGPVWLVNFRTVKRGWSDTVCIDAVSGEVIFPQEGTAAGE